MTSYHGGKQKIGKKIAENIQKKINTIPKGYCEPFCGMLGVFHHIIDIYGDSIIYKAGDANKSVIEMWNAVIQGWIPPISTTREEYDRLRYDGKNTAQKGFIGHQYSFGGQYFHGMAVQKTSYPKASQKVVDIGKKIQNVDIDFTYGDYTQFSDLENYIIYCDPPYSKCSEYYDDNRKRIFFNSTEFWNWCRKMSKKNIVFISEYNAPNDFINIFSINHCSNTKGKKNQKKENLFVHKTSRLVNS